MTDCTNDETGGFDPVIENPPGDGNPGDEETVEDIMDTNANYVVDAEDPFQSGDSVRPLELWELPEEGVTKPWTFNPPYTKNGRALFSYETLRVRELFRDYESSGTLKYMPYGNHMLPTGLDTIPEEYTATFGGLDYVMTFQQMMQSPMVDGYRACLYFSGTPERKENDMMLTFWDESTRTIAHAIRLKNSTKELVINRCPDLPGWNQRGYIGLTGSNGTNLTSSVTGTDYKAGTQRYHATQVQGKDITRITTGLSDNIPFDPQDYFTHTTFNFKNEIDDWNRYKVGFNPTARVFCGYVEAYPTPDEEVRAYGCRDRIRQWDYVVRKKGYSLHPYTLRLPTNIFSVTELDFDVMTWQPFDYAKHLYSNGLATAESMSMAAMATRVDPAGTPRRANEFADVQGILTGIAPLGNILPYQFAVPRVSDNGLRMAIQCSVNFLKMYGNASPDSTFEFSRASDNDEWVFEGAVCDDLYFDPVEFPDNWETADFSLVRKEWGNGVAVVMEEPFYDGNTLYVVSHSPKKFRGTVDPGRFRMYQPDFPNCSFKRDEGMSSLSETIVQVPGLFSSSARRVNEWTPEKCIFLVREDPDTSNWYHIAVNFVAGTWATLEELGEEPAKFPPRLAHLEDNDWYKFTSWGKRDPELKTYFAGELGDDLYGAYYDRSKIEYNGFTIVGIRDTPLVPNLGYGDRTGVSSVVIEGAYHTRSHRRSMLGVGEIVAYNSEGVEVWRAEPSDAREWCKFRTDNRTIGRNMLFGNSLPQVYPPYKTAEGDRGGSVNYVSDPEVETFLGRAYVGGLVGVGRVSFGDRLFLQGNDLYISHDSLPLGADIPETLGFYEKQKIGDFRTSNEYWATPRDATHYHKSGYVVLDLTTIPELNP